jgi:large subunit ribosomal protein L34
MSTHYPKRLSVLKKKRAQGFLARMRTKGGRKIINARRRIGRRVEFP